MSVKIEFLSGDDEFSPEERDAMEQDILNFLQQSGGNDILNLMRPDAAVLMDYPQDALLCNIISDDASSWIH